MSSPTSQDSTQSIGPPKPGKRVLNRWIVGIVIIGVIVIGVLFSLIYYTNAQVTTKSFTYTPPGSQPYNSLAISDVDGLVSITTWTSSTILINGTITARGLGSSINVVKITNSTVDGNVTFAADFPVNPGFFFSQSYSAKINVYVPSAIRFNSVEISDINGGVRAQDLNSTWVILTTLNGAQTIDCGYCLNLSAVSANGDISVRAETPITQGTYNLTSTNSDVALTVPSDSSFEAIARVENGTVGSIQVVNLPGATAADKYLDQKFGTGAAKANLSSVTGHITITGS